MLYTQIELCDRADDVEDKMLDGTCEECDQDPTKCHLQGYCEYEKEIDDGKAQ